MGIAVGSNRGIFVEINVVPLIDVLLVLLVIFMIIPHKQAGMMAQLPQAAEPGRVDPQPTVIVVQVLADGSLRINQQAIGWAALGNRLQEIFKLRANRTAFVRGENEVEFQVVARVIDVMRAAGVSSGGLDDSRAGKNCRNRLDCPSWADVNPCVTAIRIVMAHSGDGCFDD